ncbi:tetrathionate reductase subunit TtrA [Shewanella insulae]|uniref:molybdopterin dinucleotide binding domain-containing protein n=1 Tax=Shewanella insulae TaxID=2681496 RepID=UPI001EFE59BD|nr:molybdopterin dinucleotide binding domain-containing protein [Shewanella insulae]MCG9740274.1 tetrathionate reductase subunit TtrA [Shewanella insulae]
MDRRDFLKAGSVAAVMTTGALGAKAATKAKTTDAEIGRYAPTSLTPEYYFDKDKQLVENPEQRFAFSKCFGCFNVCGARVSIDNKTDKVLRAVGNPYTLTNNAGQPFTMETPPKEAMIQLSAVSGLSQSNRATLCGRGNAVPDAFEDKHRVTQCLKRVGKRGENRWQSISYEQLLKEVIEGGDLFGEGKVEGLRAIHDNPALANPNYPDFGPVKNQLLVSTSSEQGARADFLHRFVKECWGTPNIGNKDSYCGHQQVAGCALGCFDAVDEMALPQVDYEETKFAIFIGTNPGLSGNGLNVGSRRLAKARSDRPDFKYVVVDPILRSLTSEVDNSQGEWLPIISGGDTALMFAMMQYIINHDRYRRAYLEAPSQACADAIGEINYTNATYLVVKESGHPLYNQFLTAEACGLGDAEIKMVIDKASGQLVTGESDQPAELFYKGKLAIGNGVELQVETAFSLLKQRVNGHSMRLLSERCGISMAKIEELAKEFTSHGRSVAIETCTGCNASDGGQFTFAMIMLGTLVGAHNAKGGMMHMGGVGYAAMYDIYDGPLYNLMDFEHTSLTGFNAERSGDYEQSHEYQRKVAKGIDPYPAEQPWNNTFVQDNSGELLVAHANKNPFQFKAWITWATNPIYGCSGLQDQVEDSIKDPKQLGLIIALDPYINETNVLADYIVPDSLQYEQWANSRMWGSEFVGDVACVPVVASRNVKTAQGNDVNMEQFLIDISKAIGLPGMGEKAFKDLEGRDLPIHEPADFYVPLFANIAHTGSVLPSPTEEDIAFTSVDRVLPLFKARLKPEELGPTAYMLTRGGRYERVDERYEGDFFNPMMRMDTQFQVYNESLARVKDSYSGQFNDGQPVYDVDRFWDGSAVRQLWKVNEYPFNLSTFKLHLRSPYSVALPRITALGETNYIHLHEDDAAKFDIKDGDKAQVLSPKGKHIEGIVQADKTVARNTIVVGMGYGHWCFGASDLEIDGQVIPGIPSRGTGICPNPFNIVDPSRKGASLYRDRTFGSTARHGVPVAIRKV